MRSFIDEKNEEKEKNAADSFFFFFKDEMDFFVLDK
jgi:hypothetical protein